MSRRLVGGVLVALVMGGLLGGPTAQGQERKERWGPFRGEIVDVETAQPLAGVAVLVVWWEVYGIFGNHRFVEAREAVTDAAGRFEIPWLTGYGWVLGIQPPTIHVFAPGYVAVAEVVTPDGGEVYVDPTVLQMRRLKTREELLRKISSEPSGVPPEKMIEFLKTVNEERRMLGFTPMPLPRGGTAP